jgi:peptidoglycan/xylan/chitin deacetylase (PgdA/CDA1 family)
MNINNIMFHYFHDKGHSKSQGSISAEQLDTMIDFIGRSKIVDPGEWLDELEKSPNMPAVIALTFDDGLLCQYDVALPVLQHRGIKAFWFVTSSGVCGEIRNSLEAYRYFRSCFFESIDDFYCAFAKMTGSFIDVYSALSNFSPGEYLKDFPFYSESDRKFRYLRDVCLGERLYHDCMQRLFNEYKFDPEAVADRLWIDNTRLKVLAENGHEIGLHSYSHPTMMSRLSFDEQRTEYLKNYEHINSVTGLRPRCMAHPCDSYNHDSLRAIQELGINVGFRGGDSAMQHVARSNLELPRTNHSLLVKHLSL